MDESRSGRRTTWIIAAIAGGSVALVSAVAIASGSGGQREPPAPSTHTVVYEAEGAGATSADYTLRSPNGTVQADTDLPMKNQAGGLGLHFPGFKSGAFVYLSVQNSSGSGSVTCRIKVDGIVVSENTSSGAFKIATCQGRVG